LIVDFGAVELVLVWFTLRKASTRCERGTAMAAEDRPTRYPGAILLLGAISCLNLALQWGGIVHPWSDPKVFGCLIGFGFLTITFLYL
jgi:hypothetical protein